MDIDSPRFDKARIEELNTARNCVVHSGCLNKDTANKLCRLGAGRARPSGLTFVLPDAAALDDLANVLARLLAQKQSA